MSQHPNHPAVDVALGTPPALVVFAHYFSLIPLQSWVYIVTITYTILATVRLIWNWSRELSKDRIDDLP